MKYKITAYNDTKHREPVISLWQEVFGYEASHNAPKIVIDKKIQFKDELFFVALEGDSVIGTVMAGYDGHRGWIYSIAASPGHRKEGLGSALLSFAEEKLSERGCMKINLQIMEGNEAVENFYISNGYKTEKRISMGKRLPQNISSAASG
jgi:ribosomal protein S18 acetylase RimI-like enzyme